MKTIAAILITVITAISCSFADAPSREVLNSFDLKFPNATDIKWGKEKSKEWEADFNFNGDKLSANFTMDGKWLETEKQINISDLPIEVANAVQLNYPGWKITQADLTETSKSGIIYEADITLGKAKEEVAFKSDGSKVVE